MSMRRFRPNLVVTGATPWAEDRWRRLTVGGVQLVGLKLCSRCSMTTNDPDTGKLAGVKAEPLKVRRARGDGRAPGACRLC